MSTGIRSSTTGRRIPGNQRFLFPEGVPFDGESFGTAVTSPLFSRLRAWERAKGKMVTQVLPSWNEVREWLLDLGELRSGFDCALGAG